MDVNEYKKLVSLSLEEKIKLSLEQVRQFYEFFDGKVYVSFSGGKDSTVLLHLIRTQYPEAKAVFVDTGLEYPVIKDFVKTIPNVTTLRPKMSFCQVITKYGYPVISKEQARWIRQYRTTKSEHLKNLRWNGDSKKHYKISEKWKFLIDAPFKISDECCDVLKKRPFKLFEKETKLKPFIGNMATDSRIRMIIYLTNGCNFFSKVGSEKSTPLAFWATDDVWAYIKKFNVPYCDIYNHGIQRTGCIFCLFGIHKDKGQRFVATKQLYPKLYDYCMNNLGIREIIDYLNANSNANIVTEIEKKEV